MDVHQRFSDHCPHAPAQDYDAGQSTLLPKQVPRLAALERLRLYGVAQDEIPF